MVENDDLKELTQECKDAAKKEAVAIRDALRDLGALFFDVSKVGISWEFQGRESRGVANGKRGKMVYTGRVALDSGIPEIRVLISPQTQGTFYPHQMSLREFKAACGGGDAFNKLLAVALKSQIEDAKKTAETMKAREVARGPGGIPVGDFIL
jgi:hypothetical protein